MTQTTQANTVQWISLVLIILLIIGGLVYIPNLATNDDVSEAVDSIDIPIVDVPTAKEIADLIKVDVPTQRNNNDNLDDVLEALYPLEVGLLESQCTNDLEEEFLDSGDVFDSVQDLIEANEGEEIENLGFSDIDFNYDNDYDFNVINLGLDDEEDKEAEITSTLKVTYTLEDGNGDKLTDRIYTLSTCSDFDEDDNEFNDLTVEYSLNDRY